MNLTSSQSILEDLLEAQKLQDRQVDCRVETETSFVWSKCRVELDSVTTVYLWLVLVIFPDHPELDDTLGDGDDLEGSLVFWLLLEEGGVFEGGDKLCGEYVRGVDKMGTWVGGGVDNRHTFVGLLELGFRRKVRHVCGYFLL